MSLVLLSKRMETICFLFLTISNTTKFASMRKWARVRKTCTRAYTREVRSPSLAKCGVGEKKSGNSGQHSKTYKQFNNMTFWTFSSTWWSSCSIWRISNLFAFFKFERKWKLFAKKKKCYIALWIICVLWTFNLLDSISISNNSTRLLSNNKKKEMFKNKTGCLGTFCTNRERTVA